MTQRIIVIYNTPVNSSKQNNISIVAHQDIAAESQEEVNLINSNNKPNKFTVIGKKDQNHWYLVERAKFKNRIFNPSKHFKDSQTRNFIPREKQV